MAGQFEHSDFTRDAIQITPLKRRVNENYLLYTIAAF